MPRQDQTSLPGLPELPDDTRNARGQRRSGSRWTYFRREIQVTQEHIDSAMQMDSHACMVAEAIKSAMPDVKMVQVDIATMRWTDTVKHRRIVCLTPREAQHGLVCFDRGMPVKPFSFVAHAIQILPARKPGEKAAERMKARVEKPPKGSLGKVIGSPEYELRLGQGRAHRAQAAEGGDPVHARQRDRRALRRARHGETTAEFVIHGGSPPPHHHPSRDRRFGLKAFTWDDSSPTS